MIEVQKPVEILEQFDQLNLGDTLRVPLSLLQPTIRDDGLKSYSTGPVEVYLSQKTRKGQTTRVLAIDDGHHRYFAELRRIRGYGEGRERVKEQTLIEVRKVRPEHG